MCGPVHPLRAEGKLEHLHCDSGLLLFCVIVLSPLLWLEHMAQLNQANDYLSALLVKHYQMDPSFT